MNGQCHEDCRNGMEASIDSATAVVDRLRHLTGAASDSELARHLGVGKMTVSNWRSRDSTPYRLCLQLAQQRGISLDWLLLGRGTQEASGHPSVDNGEGAPDASANLYVDNGEGVPFGPFDSHAEALAFKRRIGLSGMPYLRCF